MNNGQLIPATKRHTKKHITARGWCVLFFWIKGLTHIRAAPVLVEHEQKKQEKRVTNKFIQIHYT